MIPSPRLRLIPTRTGWECITLSPSSGESGGEVLPRQYPGLTQALEAEPGIAQIALPASWCWQANWEFPVMPDEELEEALGLRMEQTFGQDSTSLNWCHRGDKTISTDGAESVSVTVWVVTPAGEKALAELDTRDLLPGQVFPWPECVAAAFFESDPEAQVGSTLLVLNEGDDEVLLLVTSGARCIRTAQIGLEEVGAWQRVMVEWELSGLDPGDLKVWVQSSLVDWFASLGQSIADSGMQTFETFENIPPPAETPVWADLTPRNWKSRLFERRKSIQLRKRILTGAMIYGVLLVALSAWAWVSHQRAVKLSREASTLGPAMDEVAKLSRSWTQFEPIFKVERHPVDLLMQVANAASQEKGFKLTRYIQQGQQITMEGETPDVALFYQFVEALKSSPGLQGAVIEPGEPISGKDGSWNFRIHASWGVQGAVS